MTKKILISLSVIVGLLSVLPYVVAYTTITPAHDTEHTLHYFYQDAELVYLSRIREVVEGNIHIASPMFFEYKQSSHLQQPFSEWLYAIGSLGQTEFIIPFALLAKLLLPGLLFLLVYLVSARVCSLYRLHEPTSIFVAVCISALVVLGYDLNNVGVLRAITSGEYSEPILSLWTRLVHPITGALGLFALSYSLLTLGRESKGIAVIAPGLILGCLSGYVFSFALGTIMSGLMLCFALWNRDWEYGKRVMAILVIACIVNIPYFVTLFATVGDPASLTKNGLLLTHAMLHNKSLYLVGCMLVLIGVSMRFVLKGSSELRLTNRAWQWSISTVVAGVLCYNQQVLTGQTVWPGHFVQYTLPFSYVVFFTSIYYFISHIISLGGEWCTSRFQRGVKFVSVIGVLLIFTVNILYVESVFSNAAVYGDTQRYADALNWINENAVENCVVLVHEREERLEKFIPAYTHCDLYDSTYVFFGIPRERIMHNYITRLRLFGVEEDELRNQMDTHELELRRYFFNDWVDMFYGNNDYWVQNTKTEEEKSAFLPQIKAEVIEAFEKSEKKTADELLTEYAITHIIIDTRYETLTPSLLTYEVVYESNNIVILAVE